MSDAREVFSGSAFAVGVKGLKELQAALDSLPAKIEANVVRGAMRAAALVVEKEAEATAAFVDRKGYLRKSVRVSVRLRGGRVVGKLVAGDGDAWYAHMIEKGTKQHIIAAKEEDRPSRMTSRGVRSFSIGTMNKMLAHGSLRIGDRYVGKSVVHPGIKATRFMTKAFESKVQEAIEAARKYVRLRLSQKHGINVPGPDDRDDAALPGERA